MKEQNGRVLNSKIGLMIAFFTVYLLFTFRPKLKFPNIPSDIGQSYIVRVNFPKVK